MAAKKTSGTKGDIKWRNPWFVLFISIITLNIYGIYWLVSTTKELRKKSPSAPNPWLLLIMLVPIANIVMIIYYYYWYAVALNEFTKFDKWIAFVLLLLVSPLGAFFVQRELNKKASKS